MINISTTETRTYKIITFGCQMNEHDSEVISGMLTQRGYIEVTDSKADPDITIINTCSIRENADKRFFGTLGQLKKIKARKPDFVVCVCGCMMQQEHVTTKLRRSYPWVDVIFGTHNIHEFPDMLEEMYENRAKAGKTNNRSSRETRVDHIYEDNSDIVEGLPVKRLYSHKSFVNIMYGCNNFCTYCIVPYTRGREKSRAPENIVAEVTDLVREGVKEVTLLGQNVNSYRGKSKKNKEDKSGEVQTKEIWDFADLIYALNEIEGLERIRFMTSHPKDLSDKLIRAFAECGKLCNYIHLPVQSGSSNILNRMNRKYTRESYIELVRKLRAAVPDMAISTDIIVGFPGETEEDFLETLTLVEEIRYDSAFTFLYSPRKGTPAATYENHISEETKHERFNRLVEVMNKNSIKKNAAYVGRTCKVLVDGPDKKGAGRLCGRTEEFKLVDFQGSSEIIGQIVEIEITNSNTFSLKGKLV